MINLRNTKLNFRKITFNIKNLKAFLLILFILFFGLIVKYPLPKSRDPKSIHYWNLSGVYVKATRNPCPGSIFVVNFCEPRFDFNIPFISQYSWLVGSDPLSFKVKVYYPEYVFSDMNEKNLYIGVLAVDNYHVFYMNNLISNGDPRSLQLEEDYAKDKNNIYRNGEVITSERADISSLTFLECGFSKDDQYVYTINIGQPLPLADAATFTVISQNCNPQSPIAADKNFSYKHNGAYGVWISGITNGSTIKYTDLGCGYSVIEGSVYHMLQKIENADVNSFKSYSQGDFSKCGYTNYARDANNIYFGGKLVKEADSESFAVFELLNLTGKDFDLNGIYAFDNNFTYYHETPYPKEGDQWWTVKFIRAYKIWKTNSR